MNMFLSILVCIAMLCSPTGALPAQPETATTWTLRNLTLSYDGESVTLAPEAVLTTAIGTEKAQAHFEVHSGEEVLMPLTGEITAEAARFTLGHGAKAYAVSDATLTEAMDLDPEDAQILAACTDFMKDYCTLLGRVANDEDFALKVSEAAMQAMMEAGEATVEETEVEVDGAKLPGQRIHMNFTLTAALKMLDNLCDCGIPEVDAVFQDYADMVLLMEGEDAEFTSFADLASEMEDVDLSLPWDMTFAMQDDLSYADMTMNFDAEDDGSMELRAEATGRGEDVDMIMTMRVDANNTVMDAELAMQTTGPTNAPEKVHAEYSVNAEDHTFYPYTEGEGDAAVEHTCEYVNTVELNATLDGATVDGLEDMTLAATVSNHYTSYTDGEEDDSDDSSVRFDMRSSERAEADGSVTAATALRFDVDGEAVEISFDLNRAEGPFFDLLESLEECPITADMNEDSPAVLSLTSDAMDLASDAMRLAADDSVIALTQMLGMSPEAADADGTEYAEDDSYAPQTVDSFEEAAAIFDGTIPQFTAPEGFALDGIKVTEYSLNAKYVSGEDSFNLEVYSSGIEDIRYYAFENGALRAAPDGVALMYCYIRDDEVVDSATVHAPEYLLNFSFDMEDSSPEVVESILAGLNG